MYKARNLVLSALPSLRLSKFIRPHSTSSGLVDFAVTAIMSYLQNKVQSFNANLGTVAGKISNKRTVAAPVKPAPSPTPSQASDSSKNDLKRKRPDIPEVPYSQPRDTGTGTHIMTQITYAIEYLKTKNTPQSISDILSYLSLQTREQSYKAAIEKILRSHEKVNYQPASEGTPALFSFRPAHNIRSADSLLSHLQSQHTAQGLSVKELRDGWPDAEDAITRLEAGGKLLVTRNKKDNHARMVWLNDPSLNFEVDEEFQNIWHRIKLPEPGALADELEKEGLTPANKNRIAKKPVKVQEKQKRKPRSGGRTTNVHMAGILRDYSHLKR
ncbi:MAG: hypothetical protein LQ338_001302 [Usnochroma carphineum]|nr:MAG: hypothetical protein LQ338_001302 [Usnochroma carphineum]